MILVFGGTTEGRKAVRVLDSAGNPYFYSTRGTFQEIECKYGTRISGTMDAGTISMFCQEHGVCLLVDAAHPFAAELRKNIAIVAEKLDLPVVRYERDYPRRDPACIWCDSFEEAAGYLEKQKTESLLALSGVQTIPRLKSYWQEHPCWFRVLKREESVRQAENYGFPSERLVFYEEGVSVADLIARLNPKALLTKESGETGFFGEKIEAATRAGIPVIVVKRPAVPENFYTVRGENSLRHRIERLLPGFFPLKSGYTTGSCACAAAKAALSALITGKVQGNSCILLPCGEEIELAIASTSIGQHEATCAVVKDAGDDPDVTNGCEILATVRWGENEGVRFLPGKGVGTVTLPGLGLAVGEPAVNPTPRCMIASEIEKVLKAHGMNRGVEVILSVPRGEELALKTFNPKLGIVGGISIIGTSGVVRPFSSEAFVATIRKEIQVAKALGCRRIVINSGAKSERELKERFPDLLPQAFVHYGNYIEETLKMAEEEGLEQVTMGIMIGKAVKLAEGHGDTHSRNVVMNREFLISLAEETGCSSEICSRMAGMTLARELWDILPEKHPFFALLLQKCEAVCRTFLVHTRLDMMLIR